MESVCREPYRVLFPLGLIYGIWGVFLWIAFGSNAGAIYPGTIHAFLMIGGFLACFAFGFLMTAIPRFTRSTHARRVDLIFVAAPLTTLPLFALSGDVLFVLLPLLISFVAFGRFALTRYRGRQSDPPDSFVFVGAGVLSGFFGTVLLVLQRLAPSLNWGEWPLLGRNFLFQSFMISLLVGVGSKLIPGLLGWVALPTASPDRAHQNHPRRFWESFLFLAAVFLLSFPLEVFVSSLLGRGIRTLVITWIAFRHWRLSEFPLMRSILAKALWTSCWFTVIGVWGALVFPSYYIHFLHFTFIGGLGLTTLMIATRVVLAHGGFNLILESKLTTLWWITGFILVAALTRTASGLAPNSFYSHLMYPALSWIVGLLIWAFSLGQRIVFPAVPNSDESSC